MKKFGFIWAAAVVLCLYGTVSSCSSTNDTPDEPEPVVPVVPIDPVTPEVPTLSEDEASGSLAELMSRCMLAAIAPDDKCNDAERLWELIHTIYYQPETRGVWSTAAGLVKFKQAINNANALYRATLLGAMIETKQTGKDARQSIWKIIMKAPAYGSQKLPDAYRVGCDDFWQSFSRGEFDDAAVFIYTAVISERLSSPDTPAQIVANYLDYHDLYEIKMMLRCAGPIIEQGCNIVFATGDDLISWGQTAYDFVNNNGKVVLEACKGNLTAESCVDAINTNLKLLTNGLEEVLPQGGDLAGVLADLTADQVKDFNKAVQDALNTAGATRLSPEDVSWFVTQVQDIIGVGMPPSFIDQVFFNTDDMTQISIESRDGHAYQFFYTDRHGNVLMEGKCAINDKNLSILVDELNTDRKCDLLPKSGIPQAGILTIPYHVMSEGTLVLWYKSSDPKSKYFSIMNDEDTENFFEELTLSLFVTGKKGGTTETQVLRATKSNGAIFGKDDISTSYFGDGLWVHGLKDFKTSDGTTLRHKIEFLLDSNDVFNLSSAQRFSYSCWEIDAKGNKTSYWTIYSNAIPLAENNKVEAIWLAEESQQNMSVSYLAYREDMRTVCDTYVPVSGTNRIEINVKKGELPKQLKVNPTALEISYEAGDYDIIVKEGNYRYRGYFFEDEEPDWLSPWFHSDSILSVRVKENTSSKDRTAKLIVWAANAKYDKLDLEKDMYDTVRVTIVQKGRIKHPHVTRISYNNSFPGCLGYMVVEEGEKEKATSNYTRYEKGVIDTEQVGKGLRITATKTEKTVYNNPDRTPETDDTEITIIIPDWADGKWDISEFYCRNKRAMNIYRYFMTFNSELKILDIPESHEVRGPDIKIAIYEHEWWEEYTNADGYTDWRIKHTSGYQLDEDDYFTISIRGTDLSPN